MFKEAVLKQSELREFSVLVEAIYDCALHPENWASTTKMICSYVGGDAVALDFTDIRLQEPVAGYSFGYSKEYRELLIQKYAHRWLLQSGFPNWKVGKPMRLHEIVSKNEFENGIFYREWCKPQGHYDYTGMIAFRDQTRFVKMTNARLEERKSFSIGDAERLNLLSAHICKSVSISDALNMTAIYSEALETTLDQLKASVFLIGGNGKISFMNAAAEKLVKTSPCVKIKNGMLTSSGSALETAIAEAKKLDTEDGLTISNHQHSVAIPASTGEGLIALVLQLQDGNRRSFGLAAKANLAIFIREPHAPIDFSGEAFASLYGISAAEMKVLIGLSQRLKLSEISDTLGIALPTVKSHLQRLFEKTGTSKQTDLVLLISNASTN
jgi:DNA-binding CsgD family transcriptional regulator/PAS domain-containing protein